MRGGEVSVAIINYGVGNLLSISTSLRKVGAEPRIVENIRDVESFDAVVLPGVGAFKPAIRKLMEHEGMVLRFLAEKPVLGICLGMQLLYERSEEGCPPGGYVKGFGIFKGSVKRFPAGVKVPQMGWNTIRIIKHGCPLASGIPGEVYVYYANSYASLPSEETVAITEYGVEFTAMAWRENVFGTQFHPEKSGRWGLAILRNFIDYVKGWRR